MPQDPFNKWKTSKATETPKDDPFTKWKNERVDIKEEPKKELSNLEKLASGIEFEGEKEEPGFLMDIWNAATTPLTDVPTVKAREISDYITTPKLDENKLLAMYKGSWGGAIEGASDLIPTSPLGIVAAVAGGPIAKGALRVGGSLASKIPGGARAVEALANMMTKERTLPFMKSAGTKLADEILAVQEGKVLGDIPEIKPQAAPAAEIPQQPAPVITKLQQALKESKPLNEQQAKLLTAERAEKFGKAEQVDIVDKDSAKKFMSNLAGEHTKVSREPLKLDEPDVQSLFKMVGDALKADTIDVPRSAQAITGLRKLLDGGVPVPSEIETLEKVFGSGLAEFFPSTITNRQAIVKAINIPKALVSAIDIGFPFRHGINRVGQKEWFGMLRPAIESWASEAAETKWMDAIKAHPRYDLMKQSGLPLGGKVGGDREEAILASVFNNQTATNKFGKGVLWLENKIAKLPGVAHSNRGHNIASAKIRSDLFESQYQDYKRLYDTTKKLAGTDKTLLENVESLNPDNLFRAKQIADLVATSTGRGSLGRLEPIAQELNSALFAPRLMSARIKTLKRVLNPASYVQTDPIQRKDTLKQMISLAGTVLSTGAMFKAAGGDVEIDPWNSDFGKGKIGNTRFDMGGGYLQYIVPFAKIMRSMAGKPVESTRGGEYMLGEKYGADDRLDVLERFLTNRSSPLGSLFISMMRGREPSGKDIDMTTLNPMENTVMKSIIPIIMQDVYQLVQEDPSLLPLIAPSMLGGSVEVHNNDQMFADSIGRRR